MLCENDILYSQNSTTNPSKYLLHPFSDIQKFNKSKKLFQILLYKSIRKDSIIKLIIRENDPDHLRLLFSYCLTYNMDKILKAKLISAMHAVDVPLGIIDSHKRSEAVFKAKEIISKFIIELKYRDQYYKSQDININIKNLTLQAAVDSKNSNTFWQFLSQEPKWPSYYYLETIKPREGGLFDMKLNLYVFLIHQIHSDPVIADSVRGIIINSFEKGEATFGEFINYESNYIQFFPNELFGYGSLPGLSPKHSMKLRIAQLYALSRFLLYTKAKIRIIINSNDFLSVSKASYLVAIRNLLICFGVSDNQLSFSIQTINIMDDKFVKIVRKNDVIYKIENMGSQKLAEMEW